MHKNIILLADGTGNGAASPFKTNVWRLYQTVDIKPPTDPNKSRQIVYYDNGVGTENFRPLAALGGALGIGVWTNVRDIYTFVCRNYQDGDQIYGFGFSRGAFTIRLVMGMIGKCGIIKAKSERDLLDCVQMAYEAYRRDYLMRASRRRGMIYHWVLRFPNYQDKARSRIDLRAIGCEQEFPDIRFLGVWDTVDAYGMPIDEMKYVIDDWIWPMSFADRDPSKRIQTIRHALSLDDERPTFRPVLWNEVIKNPVTNVETTLGTDQIQQVWFAGVHANVGGGYPDDGLAFTTLTWMMDEAANCGLRYDKLFYDELTARRNPHGEEYDSRSGIAAYYRYGPRQIAALSDDKQHGVTVPTIRVHPDAFERITRWQRGYQPVSIDAAFEVGGVAVQGPNEAALQDAWDLVWWRRMAYFATVALTCFMALFFLCLLFDWPRSILSVTEMWLASVWRAVASLIGAEAAGGVENGWAYLLDNLGDILPSWAEPIVPFLKEYSLSAAATLVLLVLMFAVVSPALERRIGFFAEYAWAAHKQSGAAPPKRGWMNKIGRPMRKMTAILYHWVVYRFLIKLSAIAVGLAVFVLLSPYLIWRVVRRKPWMA